MRHMGDNATLQRMLRRAVRRAVAARLLDHRGPGRRQHPLERSAGRAPRRRAHHARAQGERHLLRRVRGWRRDDRAPRRRCGGLRSGAGGLLQERLHAHAPAGLGRARHARHLQRGLHAQGAMRRAEQIMPEPYENIHSRTMVPCAHLLWGSVWTGIAAARDRARPGLRPQRHAPRRAAAAGRAAVHPGAGHAAHAARDAVHLATHATSVHGRSAGARRARFPDH